MRKIIFNSLITLILSITVNLQGQDTPVTADLILKELPKVVGHIEGSKEAEAFRKKVKFTYGSIYSNSAKFIMNNKLSAEYPVIYGIKLNISPYSYFAQKNFLVINGISLYENTIYEPILAATNGFRKDEFPPTQNTITFFPYKDETGPLSNLMVVIDFYRTSKRLKEEGFLIAKKGERYLKKISIQYSEPQPKEKVYSNIVNDHYELGNYPELIHLYDSLKTLQPELIFYTKEDALKKAKQVFIEEDDSHFSNYNQGEQGDIETIIENRLKRNAPLKWRNVRNEFRNKEEKMNDVYYTQRRSLNTSSPSNMILARFGECISGNCRSGIGKLVFNDFTFEGSFSFGAAKSGTLTNQNGVSLHAELTNGVIDALTGTIENTPVKIEFNKEEKVWEYLKIENQTPVYIAQSEDLQFSFEDLEFKLNNLYTTKLLSKFNLSLAYDKLIYTNTVDIPSSKRFPNKIMTRWNYVDYDRSLNYNMIVSIPLYKVNVSMVDKQLNIKTINEATSIVVSGEVENAFYATKDYQLNLDNLPDSTLALWPKVVTAVTAYGEAYADSLNSIGRLDLNREVLNLHSRSLTTNFKTLQYFQIDDVDGITPNVSSNRSRVRRLIEANKYNISTLKGLIKASSELLENTDNYFNTNSPNLNTFLNEIKASKETFNNLLQRVQALENKEYPNSFKSDQDEVYYLINNYTTLSAKQVKAIAESKKRSARNAQIRQEIQRLKSMLAGNSGLARLVVGEKQKIKERINELEAELRKN